MVFQMRSIPIFGRVLRGLVSSLNFLFSLASDVLIGLLIYLVCSWVFDRSDDSINGQFLHEFAREFAFSFTACSMLALVLTSLLRLTAEHPSAKYRVLWPSQIRGELLRVAFLIAAIVVSIKGVTHYRTFFGPLQWQVYPHLGAFWHLSITVPVYVVVATLYLRAVRVFRWDRWPTKAIIRPTSSFRTPFFGLPWYELPAFTRTSIAIIVGVTILTLGVLIRTIPNWPGGSFQTDHTGRIVILRDGTQLILNRDTHVETKVTLFSREIRLLRGEIVVNAARNAWWHDLEFFVNDVSLRDHMGYQAHVRRRDALRVDITMMQAGAVRVELPYPHQNTPEGRVISLRDNQHLVVSPNSAVIIERAPDNVLNDLSWATIGDIALWTK